MAVSVADILGDLAARRSRTTSITVELEHLGGIDRGL